MKTHYIKIEPKYFCEVKLGIKTFELRKNDRDYQVGDTLVLQEWDGVDYTGREIKRNVTYMLSGCNGLYGDYCILGIKKSHNDE